MISLFPEFSPLTIDVRSEFEGFTKKFPPYSDFNFTSLFCWDTNGSVGVSNLNNNLVIKMPDYLTSETTYSILGENRVDESIETLLSVAGRLKLVPEVVVANISPAKHFLVVEDRDNFDYIYSINNLVNLSGQDYKKKRNKLHAAKRDLAGRWSISSTSTINNSLKAAIGDLFSEWAHKDERTFRDAHQEQKALSRMLDEASSLNLLLTIISVDQKYAGFSINEVLSPRYAIAHFEKALPRHDNIYLLLVNQVAVDLKAQGCELVNWEQDLGIEGIKKSKMSYGPEHFLKKYLIS